jgi:hypothetical protein
MEDIAAIEAAVLERVANGRVAFDIPELGAGTEEKPGLNLFEKSAAYERIHDPDPEQRLPAVKVGRATKVLASDLLLFLRRLPRIEPGSTSRWSEIARGAVIEANKRMAAARRERAPPKPAQHKPTKALKRPPRHKRRRA